MPVLFYLLWLDETKHFHGCVIFSVMHKCE